jgi:2'-5' RNA ligase
MAQQDLFSMAPVAATNTKGDDKPAARPQHTWFFALRPVREDAQRIHAEASRLLAAKGITGKRIDPERLHITLEWVGHDVSADVVDLACRAADTLALPPLEPCFDAAMSFSAPSAPLVLVGTQGLDAVRKLRAALVCAMADHGFAPPRAYEPHMTLCYDPRHRLARTAITPLSFRAEEFALVKSYIGFSRHEVLRTWRLRDATARCTCPLC